ncbi:hypothetical protein B0J11DRAFT_588587 [Dendryphion nanum]|uniref:Uncharacterized protein n=1 Tax=Dendryphion nanum TaxID=256645 RepID=A0A9P9EJS5_9PLEO|nr:hypothetical protein B0J11DRAFT_588587 [Dendryphion nanum]
MGNSQILSGVHDRNRTVPRPLHNGRVCQAQASDIMTDPSVLDKQGINQGNVTFPSHQVDALTELKSRPVNWSIDESQLLYSGGRRHGKRRGRNTRFNHGQKLKNGHERRYILGQRMDGAMTEKTPIVGSYQKPTDSKVIIPRIEFTFSTDNDKTGFQFFSGGFPSGFPKFEEHGQGVLLDCAMEYTVEVMSPTEVATFPKYISWEFFESSPRIIPVQSQICTTKTVTTKATTACFISYSPATQDTMSQPPVLTPGIHTKSPPTTQLVSMDVSEEGRPPLDSLLASIPNRTDYAQGDREDLILLFETWEPFIPDGNAGLRYVGYLSDWYEVNKPSALGISNEIIDASNSEGACSDSSNTDTSSTKENERTLRHPQEVFRQNRQDSPLPDNSSPPNIKLSHKVTIPIPTTVPWWTWQTVADRLQELHYDEIFKQFEIDNPDLLDPYDSESASDKATDDSNFISLLDIKDNKSWSNDSVSEDEWILCKCYKCR